MNKILLISGLILGIFGVIGYFIQGVIIRRKWSTDDAVFIFVSGSGISAALQVCWLAIAYWDHPPINEVAVQVFMGGFALGLFALVAAVNKFKR